jgi:hypothetical protein
MSVFDKKLLIPPIVYSDVSDSRWEAIFGRVNSRSVTTEDRKKKHGTSYMDKLSQHMRSHAATQEGKGKV